MSRVVKRPEVRRAEILETARQFFFHKGYDETSIQDIIDIVGLPIRQS